MQRRMMQVVTVTILAVSAGTAQAQMQDAPMVGGQEMYPSKDIVDNAVNSADHTTLVAAVKAAGLVETLLQPANKQALTSVLTYHVVAGRYDANVLMDLIKKGGGKATLTTVNGQTLTLMMNGSNGVILVVDRVLLPA